MYLLALLNNMDATTYHKKLKGKFAITSRAKLKTRGDLALAYTPGVALPAKAIAQNPALVYDYTRKHNTVAVVTDGSAVLGLGNIGPLASLPVMEGKCVLFNELAGVDAFPIALDTQDTDEIVRTLEVIAPMFGGINLEDISAPRCFEVERRLQQKLSIPVMHDDQHGTSMAVLAALINALRVVSKQIQKIRVVISGAGAAGDAIARLLLAAGARDIVILDSKGIIYEGRPGLDAEKSDLARITNRTKLTGSFGEALKNADVFIGVSRGNILKAEVVKTMAPGAIVFAMANPEPEILPQDAKRAGAAVVATGRSDFANQVNNSLIFPGFFRGLLDGRIKTITTEMQFAAAKALAGCVKKPTANQILPGPLDKSVARVVARAVQKAAK
jgi:malate dehydrogenase (oxaloacetate-decarboxylating)